MFSSEHAVCVTLKPPSLPQCYGLYILFWFFAFRCYVFLLVALSCCEEAGTALAVAAAVAVWGSALLRCGSGAAEELGFALRAG